MKKNNLKTVALSLLIFFLFKNQVNAQTNRIEIDINCERFIGDESELDRTKYFSIHDAGNDAESRKFREDYNVTGGRQFWGPYPRAKQITGEVGVYPPDKEGNDDLRSVRSGFVSTQHPRDVFLDGLDIVKAADWAVEYFKDYVNNGEAQEFFEVMNEPFVHADDFYPGWNVNENNRIKLQMAQLYNEVGKMIHGTPALANMKVIGYSSAWPSLELNDFGHWEDNMKMFMDVAGENMYGFSTHLYDGINVTGQDSKRSGSNSEAILDLIENYSYAKWGTIKPHAITEYGAIESGYGDDYSKIASAQTMISINHILFNLLDRQDRITCSIPFITGKATWHITAGNNYQPYTPVLWIPKNLGEPLPATGWEYSPRIYFYELWKDVKGKRVHIKSNNPDIQSHAFVNGNKLFLALSNLDENSQSVDISMLANLSNLQNVKTKALKVYVDALADLSISDDNVAPSSINLIKDETVVLEYSFDGDVKFDNAIRSKNYFTTTHLQSISANVPINYTFNNIATGAGFASLRMSIGRKHNVSKKPIVTINGSVVEVPDNWKGYDQANRDDFFGMIEIPFSVALLRENNEVSIEFPDSGGRISSLILTVDKYDKTPSGGALGTIKTVSNPCPNGKNGKISVTALSNDSYEVRIIGNGIDQKGSFTTSMDFKNLESGVYEIHISSASNPDITTVNSITILEPEPLSVFSKVDKGKQQVTLDLHGAQRYRINLNDVITVTDQSSITLQLNSGENNLVVSTDKDCQGKHKQNIIVFDQVTIFPTLVDREFTIAFPEIQNKPIDYQIISTTGRIVAQESIENFGNQLNVNVSHLSTGLYFINVIAPNINFQSKLIKK